MPGFGNQSFFFETGSTRQFQQLPSTVSDVYNVNVCFGSFHVIPFSALSDYLCIDDHLGSVIVFCPFTTFELGET